MSTLLSLAQAGATVLLGVGSVWFSRRAAKLSEPTGNGFSGHVLTSLDLINRRLTRLEEKFDDHSDRGAGY